MKSGSDQGICAALLFALVAERLATYYEHGQWLKDAQGATLAAGWLVRAKRSLPADRIRSLSAVSDQFARQIEGSLSREAGLYTAHEMMESLDPNHHSEMALSLMDECTRRVKALDGA